MDPAPFPLSSSPLLASRWPATLLTSSSSSASVNAGHLDPFLRMDPAVYTYTPAEHFNTLDTFVGEQCDEGDSPAIPVVPVQTINILPFEDSADTVTQNLFSYGVQDPAASIDLSLPRTLEELLYDDTFFESSDHGSASQTDSDEDLDLDDMYT